MQFKCTGYSVQRYVDEPVKLNLDILISDIRPSEIDKISTALALIEKILATTFILTPATNQEK